MPAAPWCGWGRRFLEIDSPHAFHSVTCATPDGAELYLGRRLGAAFAGSNAQRQPRGVFHLFHHRLSACFAHAGQLPQHRASNGAERSLCVAVGLRQASFASQPVKKGMAAGCDT